MTRLTHDSGRLNNNHVMKSLGAKLPIGPSTLAKLERWLSISGGSAQTTDAAIISRWPMTIGVSVMERVRALSPPGGTSDRRSYFLAAVPRPSPRRPNSCSTLSADQWQRTSQPWPLFAEAPSRAYWPYCITSWFGNSKREEQHQRNINHNLPNPHPSTHSLTYTHS